MSAYYVVIECPDTGKALRTGVELDDLAAFDLPSFVAKPCLCPHCGKWHVWTRGDAWLEGRWGDDDPSR